MISNLWIAHRKENWSRLETLAARAEKEGLRSFNHGDLREFGLLYRQAAADLSAVRVDRSAVTLEQYLNRLTGRAHNFVYRGDATSAAGLWRFMAYGYPRVLRRLSGYVFTATGIFLLSATVAAVVVILHPQAGANFVGPAMMDSIEHHKMWTEGVLSAKPQASSGIMTNNIMVCFLALCGGILFFLGKFPLVGGLGTIFLLTTNGIEIGVVCTVCAQHHMARSLFSFMASHGALELPSIMFAGAAGLRLGRGMLFPGMLSWKHSMAQAGSDAVQLIAGVIPLLVIAGTLEAFLSPTHVPVALKFAVGSFLFMLLCLWLGQSGKSLAAHAAPAGTHS